MREKYPLTDAELKIMQFLWERSPQNMMELTRALEPETHWSKYTVITLLKRMAQKGMVLVDESGAVKTYAPAVEKSAVASEQTGALLDHMYAGRASLLVSTLVESGSMSEDDIREIMAVLEKAKNGGRA